MAEVSDYLAGLDEPAHGILSELVARVRDEVPEAEEGMSYGMAALRYRGRPLFAAVETKGHLSVFPFSPAVVDALAPQLEGYSLSKGTIRFSPQQPLPAGLVERMAALRRAEIDDALAR
jgi:uncharacterized protein YdhG (YjbR/CyaY superfamily)